MRIFATARRAVTVGWRDLLKDTVVAFFNDEALSRGAAISFYTVTSIAPLLLIVVAVAGLVFGRDAARGAIVSEIADVTGQQTAEFMQGVLANASNTGTGIVATVLGAITFLLTASGAFGEIQAALNAFWRAKPKDNTLSRLFRARAASAGLVATLGFLLVVSLAVSTGLTALADQIHSLMPFGQILITGLDGLVSFFLTAFLFASIYKVLPDIPLEWRDVWLGAVTTSLLFTIGKSAISWYMGVSAVGSAYGAAGSLIVLLFWVYYSTQIFLFGAEFTKIYSRSHGSKRGEEV